MMRVSTNPLCALALVALLGTAARAQYPLAYPQASTEAMQGNFSPLGYTALGRADEGRYQFLIPADHLPGRPARIDAIEVYTIAGTGPLTYASLTISIGSILGAPIISTNFQSNLAASAQVYNAQAVTIAWVERQWTRIRFATPYAYDGFSSLVFDFQKVIAPSATSPLLVSHATSPRADIPGAVYSFGASGSGTSQAIQASFAYPTPLLVRLIVDTPTLSVSSAPVAPNYNEFTIGSPMDLAIQGAPGSLHWVFVADGYGPFGLAQPGIAGLLFLDVPSVGTVTTGALGGSGAWSQRFTIPNLPGLVGQRFGFQAVVAGIGVRPSWTNAADLIVNN